MIDTIFIGIDPGQSGGVAALDITGAVIDLTAMPATRKQFYDWMNTVTTPYTKKLAAVECVHSMPKQGIASTFKFGKGYGEVLGIVTALQFEIHEPSPQLWKKTMLAGLDRSCKQSSIQAAENLFPAVNLVQPRCRKAHDGLAEALLLAEYCRRLHVAQRP